MTQPETGPACLGKLFVYPLVLLTRLATEKTYHIGITSFREEDSRDPAFFVNRFYSKTPDEYAEEIDNVFKLHGII